MLPYSAVQLSSYDYLKKLLTNKDGELPIWKRLAASALAGMISTTVTYPLDVIRLRLAVEPGTKGLFRYSNSYMIVSCIVSVTVYSENRELHVYRNSFGFLNKIS